MDTDSFRSANPKLDKLRNNKLSGFNYRERRHDDWLENYTLYRDKVTVNRLTQRQSVDIPLMKLTIKSLLKDVDDMPVLYFENLDNDKEKEVFLNEYWGWTVEKNKMEIKDIVDKKQAMLYGRTFDQLQIIDGYVCMSIEDPEDILVDRYMDPSDIDSSRFLIHTHIFRPLSKLEQNPDYDKDAIANIKRFYASEQGLIKASDNARSLVEKNQKMGDLGLSDVDSPILGETIVELSLHFYYDTAKGSEDEELFLAVECDDMEILMDKPLQSVIGPTKDNFWQSHLPYNTWAEDVERQDFWSDGVGDSLRTLNKVLNSWYSQEVENRTLRNFGMHYYDATKEGFTPQTFNPNPWGWYGVPGNPNEVVQKVDIPSLENNLDAMQFLIGMGEKVSGATPTQQGDVNERSVTLGEVELALGEAKERVKGMSKFYTHAWKERGAKFLKLVEAAGDKLDAVKVYKKGRNTDNIYGREIGPVDWESESGYQVKVWSQDEKNAKDTKAIEKINAIASVMPDNPKLIEIRNRKLLEFGDLTPDEINQVLEYEKMKMDALMNPPIDPMTGQPLPRDPNAQGAMMPPGAPQPPQQPMQPMGPQPGPAIS